MIEENSGKFFRFKLDFNFGFGFAEVYDFRDISSFDGTKVFVYNRIDSKSLKLYYESEITSSGIALGPISLYKYPNSRGIGAWKFLFKTNKYIIEEPPVAKDALDLAPWKYDWSILEKWHKSDRDSRSQLIYMPYENVRSFETLIVNSNVSVVKKATMKFIIDNGKKVQDYYNLYDLGNVNMFIQLVNTYYSLERCRELIKDVPPMKEILKRKN